MYIGIPVGEMSSKTFGGTDSDRPGRGSEKKGIKKVKIKISNVLCGSIWDLRKSAAISRKQYQEWPVLQSWQSNTNKYYHH